MQQLRDKLAITERTAKSEAQLKVIKYFLNFVIVYNIKNCEKLKASLLLFCRRSINCDLECLKIV